SCDFGRSHAPPRPVQHVVRAAPRVPTHLLVDALAHDDLLLAGGVPRACREFPAAERQPGLHVDAETTVVAVGIGVDGVPTSTRLALRELVPVRVGVRAVPDDPGLRLDRRHLGHDGAVALLAVLDPLAIGDGHGAVLAVLDHAGLTDGEVGIG